jgi:hypothetical protein
MLCRNPLSDEIRLIGGTFSGRVWNLRCKFKTRQRQCEQCNGNEAQHTKEEAAAAAQSLAGRPS